jgi:hypothetical protein
VYQAPFSYEYIPVRGSQRAPGPPPRAAGAPAQQRVRRDSLGVAAHDDDDAVRDDVRGVAVQVECEANTLLTTNE